ncbi:MAG: TonB-dependent receptor plug domain-containing protein [Thiobacillus sp.]
MLGCLLAADGTAQAAVSESVFLDEMPVVLSVSRLSQPINEAPAAVTVIDRDMIRASGFRDIPDLLRLVPGFSVAYTRDNTWAVGYHGLADAFSRRFQVLVDGRSIYSPHFGAVLWSDLPVAIEDIERIEVVRGPNAAMYGSNAFLAVINIITQSAAQAAGGLVSVQYGEQGMAGLLARYGGGDADRRWRVTLSTQDRDRFEDTGPDGSGNPVELRERTHTYFLSGRTDWQIDPRNDMSLQWGVSQGDWRGGRVGEASEPARRESGAAFVHLQFHRIPTPGREWRGQIYYTRNHYDADALGTIPGWPLPVRVDDHLVQTRLNLDIQSIQRLRDGLRAVWGVEWRRETVESPQNYFNQGTLDGELARLHGNLEWRVTNAWLVQGGAMVEHHYYTGTDISPRLAVNYTPLAGQTLRANISRAYRSPTFFEQDGNLVYTDTGNNAVNVVTIPAGSLLKPERLLSREVGYVGQFKPLGLEVNAKLFYDTLYDYLGSQKLNTAQCNEPGAKKCFQSVNGSSLNLRGWETELHWRPLPHLDVSAHYARVRIDYEAIVLDVTSTIIDDDLPDSAPRNTFGLLARYGWDAGWQASAGIYQTDSITWLSDGDKTTGYTRVDARLARRFKWQGYGAELALVAQSIGNTYSEFRQENLFGPKVYASLALDW